MKRMLLRNCFREIHKARNRFLSILAITALGVGFFAGIRSTSPDMRLGADQYYDKHRLMDVKLLSSLGFIQADEEALCALPEVEQAQLSYSSDAVVSNGEKNVVIKVMGLSKDWEKGINVPWLLEGRMPESPDECIVDKADFVGEAFSLGSTVTLQSGDPDKPISDTFLQDTYTVVGFFKSPMYVSFDKGTSNVGDGSVRYLMMVPEENFSLDAYTELYLTASGAAEEDSYEDGYMQLVDDLVNALEPVEEIRTQQRLEEVTKDTKQEISDAEKELEDGKKTQQEEIAKAEQEILDAKQQLAEGEEEYAQGQQDLEKELADARKKLEDGQKEYQQGLATYQENEQKYQDGLTEAEEGWKSANQAEEQLDRSEKELEESAAQVEQGLGQVEDALAQIQAGLRQLDSGETLLASARLLVASPGSFSEQQKAAIVAGLGGIDSGLQSAMQSYLDGQTESTVVNSRIDAASTQLTSQRSDLETQQLALETQKRELQTAQKQLANGAAQIAQGRQEIQQAKEQLNQVERQLEEAAKQLEEGRLDLENARTELEDGWSEYFKGKAEGEQKLADARKELDDGLS